MDSFEGLLAVVTGGGTGMGRELVVQLAAEGCSVATCDVHPDTLAETAAIAEKGAPAGTLITTHLCDVSDAAAMDSFRDAVVAQHRTDHVNLVFNNAGIGGGGSFVAGDRSEWERTFGVCWGGVYNGCRSFIPLLVASDAGHLVNTSSVNGFWASLGPGIPHTAYSSAKFAVKGLSEALIEDFRLNAPHVSVSVVMPGHVGTDIVLNTSRVLRGAEQNKMTPGELDQARRGLQRFGVDPDSMSVEDLEQAMQMIGVGFRETAPLSAAGAATIILDGVKAGRWRILVGADAEKLDADVRADPEGAYSGGGLNPFSVPESPQG